MAYRPSILAKIEDNNTHCYSTMTGCRSTRPRHICNEETLKGIQTKHIAKIKDNQQISFTITQ